MSELMPVVNAEMNIAVNNYPAVEEVLSQADAARLTEEIRQTLQTGHELLIRAFSGRAWTALGYDSWDTYCIGEFSGARMVRLDREQRREIVAEMREAGMSSRAIASGLAIDKQTVANDLRASGENSPVAEPTPITGVNGKTYQPPMPKPVVTDPVPKPLTDRYDAAFTDLRRALKRIGDLHSEESFKQVHRASLARRHLDDMKLAHGRLGSVVADLEQGSSA